MATRWKRHEDDEMGRHTPTHSLDNEGNRRKTGINRRISIDLIQSEKAKRLLLLAKRGGMHVTKSSEPKKG